MTKLIWVVFVLCVSQAWSLGEGRCQGGDGPVPFSEIAGPDQHTVSIFDTGESVERFQVWEKSRKVVYQNETGGVFEHDWTSGQERALGYVSANLARVKDAAERFISFSGLAQILDALAPGQVWSAPGAAATPIYWNKNQLFALHSLNTNRPGYQTIKYSIFDANTGKETNLQCSLHSPPGAPYRLGRGHLFPQAFLYRAVPNAHGSRLSLFRLNLLAATNQPRCALETIGQYADLIQGNVLDVVQFREKGYYLTRTDHPASNVLFDGPEGCGYFDLGQQELIFPNYDKPVFYTYARSRGLEMYLPAAKQVVPILRNAIHYPVKTDQIWLSDSGQELWLALRPGSQKNRAYLFRTPIAAPIH